VAAPQQTYRRRRWPVNYVRGRLRIIIIVVVVADVIVIVIVIVIVSIVVVAVVVVVVVAVPCCNRAWNAPLDGVKQRVSRRFRQR
jgi:hypothetical protein